MAAMFGGSGTNATRTTRYAEMQVQTSAQGVPVALLWGTQRLTLNLVWYGDFTSKPVKGKGAGKGGSKGGSTYTYTTAFIGGLCEGPLTDMHVGYSSLWPNVQTYINQIWIDQAQQTTLAKLNLTAYQGTAGQSTWPSLPAGQAIPYSSLAYVASPKYNLGYSPSLPNHGFECFGLYCGSYVEQVQSFAVSAGFIASLATTPIAGGAVYSVGTQKFTYVNNLNDTLIFSPQVPGFSGAAGSLTLMNGVGPSPVAYSSSANSTVPILDANPADIVFDFLTNSQYSIGFTPALIDSAGLSNYKTYCAAQGIFFSPLINSQEQVSQIIDRWASLTNTLIFWSEGKLKFVPLGDSPVTNAAVANGANYNSAITGSLAYIPDLTVQYDLTYNDLIDTSKKGGSSGGGNPSPPITVTRIDPADAPNHVKIEIKDRANAYNAAPVEWQDQGLVDQFGQIDAPVTQAHEVCDQTVAAIVAQLVGQRLAYVRNTYAFILGAEFSLLEPGDIVTLSDPHMGLSFQPVRIQSIDEDERFNLSVVAEEFPGSLGTVVPVVNQSGGGGTFNTQADPGNVNPPAIFEPNSALTGGVAQIYLSASGGPNWGGAAILISFDGNTYAEIGTLSAPTQQGTLYTDFPSHADPDSTDTLSVDLSISEGVLPTNATNIDADAFRTLCLLTGTFTTAVPSNGELIAYGGVAQGGTGEQFLLGGSPSHYIRRGCYGTSGNIADHAIGSFFTRINLNQQGEIGNSLFVYPLPTAYIGKTIYFKFLSFNTFGNELQDPANVTAYQYTTIGAGYGGGTAGVPTVPLGLTATGVAGGVALAWTANPPTDNVSSYTVLRATSSGGPYNQIWTGNAINHIDTTATVGTTYYYEVEATNAAGTSGPSSNASAAALPASVGGRRIAVGVGGSPITLLASDSTVYITNNSTAALQINLPSSPPVNQRILMIDEGGNAGTFNWTIKSGGTTIDTVVVNSGFSAVDWSGAFWDKG